MPRALGPQEQLDELANVYWKGLDHCPTSIQRLRKELGAAGTSDSIPPAPEPSEIEEATSYESQPFTT